MTTDSIVRPASVITFVAPGRTVELALAFTAGLAVDGRKVVFLDFSFDLASQLGVRQPRSNMQTLITTFQDECHRGSSHTQVYERLKKGVCDCLRPASSYGVANGDAFDIVLGHPNLKELDWQSFYKSAEAPVSAFLGALVKILSLQGYDYIIINTAPATADGAHGNGPDAMMGRYGLFALSIWVPDLVVLVGHPNHPHRYPAWYIMQNIDAVNKRALTDGCIWRRADRKYQPIHSVFVSPEGEHIERMLGRPIDVVLTEDINDVAKDVLREVRQRLRRREGYIIATPPDTP